MSHRSVIPLGLAVCVMTLLTMAAFAATPGRENPLPPTQVAYLTSCGGCHGIEGVSAPGEVPTLRGLTGAFLCTPEGRNFLVRLPDVALATLDDRMLTQVLNFVVFDLGAPVAGGRQARPYTVAEVARLRREPLVDTGLTAYRNRVVAGLAASCTVPAGLRIYAAKVAMAR